MGIAPLRPRTCVGRPDADISKEAALCGCSFDPGIECERETREENFATGAPLAKAAFRGRRKGR